MAGQISELTRSGRYHDAIFAATSGHHFEDDVGKMVYLLSKSIKAKPGFKEKYLLQITTKDKFPENTTLTEKLLLAAGLGARRVLCQIFFNALENLDEKQLMKFVKAIKFIKKYEPRIDYLRFEILTRKTVLERAGEKWTIGQLAKFLKRPESESINGYASLQRIAKELNFPLRPRN